MKPVLAVFNDFFDNPYATRGAIVAGQFKDFVSPWDGVTYPGINADIPPEVREVVGKRLSAILDEDITVSAMFARMTTAAMKPPHKVHSDRIMGEFSAHIYLSMVWPDDAGTAFWNHKTQGIAHGPETDEALVAADCNRPEAWEMTTLCPGLFNRCLIHDATLYHSAEGAWGDRPDNARVVLTTFFSVVR